MKLLNFTRFVFFIAIFSTTWLTAQIPGNGLVAYYPFSGNANDASGNGLNGTAASGYISANTPPTLTAGRNGDANSAYDFEPGNLSTAYINLATPALLNFDSTQSFSISAWINYTSYNSTPSIFGCGGSNYAMGWQLALVNLSGNDHVAFLIGSDTYGKQGHAVTDTTILPGGWIHLVAVNDVANHFMKIYINGVAVNVMSYTGAGSANGTELNTTACKLNATPAYNNQIGLTGPFISTNFKGVIDDVLIYNRALSDGEVSDINTATGGPTGVHEANAGNGFVVAPVPNNGMFEIKTDELKQAITGVKIYDITGRLILERNTFVNNEMFDISGYGAGSYLVKMETKDGFYTRKISVAK